MEQFTKASGPKKGLDMERVSKSGRTEASMRVTGKMIWLMEEADLFILTEMSMKENGLMTRLMGVEHMFIWTVLNIPVNGEKTNSMDSESRPGLMVLSMKATMSMEKSTELALLSGLTARCTSENFIIITSMAKECTHGPMVANMKESGAITKCTEKELSHGLTAESM